MDREEYEGRGSEVVRLLRHAFLTGRLEGAGGVIDQILDSGRGHTLDELRVIVRRTQARKVKRARRRRRSGVRVERGMGANQEVRKCEDCPALLPPTFTRGQPRKRCDDCSRIFRSVQANARRRRRRADTGSRVH